MKNMEIAVHNLFEQLVMKKRKWKAENRLPANYCEEKEITFEWNQWQLRPKKLPRIDMPSFDRSRPLFISPNIHRVNLCFSHQNRIDESRSDTNR